MRRVSTALSTGEGDDPTPSELCVACATLLGVDGTAITLMGIDGQPSAFYASAERFEAVEELQFTVGAGPAVDACTGGEPVTVEDLVPTPERWIGLAPAIVSAGVRSVLSVALGAGTARIGTFTCYRGEPGGWSEDLLKGAQASADYIAHIFLSQQARSHGETLAMNLADDGSYRREVHQAAGMLSVQLGTTVENAFLRLRAWAFANNVTLLEAATLVVRGELRLER